MRKVELSVQVETLSALMEAIDAGADAVCIGGEAAGLMRQQRLLNPDELQTGVSYAHAHNVKIYVAVNIFAHNNDLTNAEEYLQLLGRLSVDAIAVAEPGMFALAEQICPGMPRHISAQANTTNYEAVRFWHQLGAVRVAAAEGLSMEAIAGLRANSPQDVELEVTAQGNFCISHSGRRLLSSYLDYSGISADTCQNSYAIVEEMRPGEYLPVYENETGTFFYQEKGVCRLKQLPELLTTGIDCLKIEGCERMAVNVSDTVETYRTAIDEYLDGSASK